MTAANSNDPAHRPIRSFVLRTGRLTQSQQAAMDALSSAYALSPKPGEMLEQQRIFNRKTTLVLEIGFGMGGSLAEMAKAAPDTDFIGIEVHTPGLGNLLKLIDTHGLTNLKVMNADAKEVLAKHVPEGGLDRIQIYFPDPWPKKRHHKRRIIQPEFVALLASRLADNAILHLATDWEDYAIHMSEVMENSPHFSNQSDTGEVYAKRPDYRPMTKFEQRGLNLGHGVWDLIYQKAAN